MPVNIFLAQEANKFLREEGKGPIFVIFYSPLEYSLTIFEMLGLGDGGGDQESLTSVAAAAAPAAPAVMAAVAAWLSGNSMAAILVPQILKVSRDL